MIKDISGWKSCWSAFVSASHFVTQTRAAALALCEQSHEMQNIILFAVGGSAERQVKNG